MKNIFKYTSFVFAGLLFLTTACIDENYDDSSDVGITDKRILTNVLNDENESGELSIFLELVEANGLIGELTSRRTQDQLTVFAPINNAFEILAAQLEYDSVEEMLEADEEELLEAIETVFEIETTLLEILETHVATANLSANQIENGSFNSIATLSGVNIPVLREAGGFLLNLNEDLQILRTNTEGNGTVNIINRVIMPIKFTVFFEEDFGDGLGDCSATLEDWTVVDVVLEGGSGWACTNFGFEDTQGIGANGFASGAQLVDSWIISPVLESEDVELNTLKFKYASRYDGPSPQIFVILEEDYDAEAAFDMEAWTELDFNFPPPANAFGIFSDQSVEIPEDFYSESYRFAFRYTSGDGATNAVIDNIQIGEE